ncbi:hypothetical protein AS189_13060 [Arthrobacter alpinus]|uniref:FAD-binding PCMH-type domain-containing protein n=1 Tax=Arthrobacter alpinus TaxID=656366 RepID=A0A0S2M1C9_9MICC|nr:FAD-binding oxidoreductase [Arthrobacter alpinus]ALO67259.1 hypothetical protein AS189_13060 [Arthrobacter alpinus]
MTTTTDLKNSSSVLTQAIARMTEALGSDAVLLDEIQVKDFHDPYEGEDAQEYQPSFVVQPSTVEEIQAVVRIASELQIQLWTSSTGRNYGYGGSAPVVNGSVVLSLRRMNRILEINEAAGYALLEPGVSFFDLYNEIKARGLKLWISVPDLGWGSIVGNTLEHGYGYTVNGDHASAVCGMEVVLASGDVVRTGLGAMTNSPMWQRHKRGFGPSLDSLFMQSNFGIVSKMGVWLMPEPEVFATGSIICHNDEDIAPLIDALRPLVLDGTIQGLPLITSSPEPEDGRANPLQDTTGMSQKAKLSATLPPGRWNARISFYGHEALVEARREIVRAAVEHLPNVALELRSYRGDVRPEEVHPLDLVPAGIPNMFLLDMMKKHIGENVGHIDFSPAIPFDGESAAKHELMVRTILEEAGLVAGFGWIANTRSLVGACMVFFDVNDPAEAAAAHAAVELMCEKAAQWGWSEYRAHPSLIEHVAENFDFNDHALSRLYTSLKDAMDPTGTLSPGNHGIWHSAGKNA